MRGDTLWKVSRPPRLRACPRACFIGCVNPSAFPQEARSPASQAHSAGETARRKVLIVDDHAVVRSGLASLINEEQDLITCGEADSERTTLELVRQLQPDVAVVDWSLGNRDAAELLEALRADHPALPVLVLSMHDEALYAERAIRAGAIGYVMKQEASDRVVEAIRAVLDGRYYLSEKAALCVNGLAPGSRLPAAEAGTGDPVTGSSLRPIGQAMISIVIPVFNSENSIGRLVAQLIAELAPSYRLQIVLVDDGSRDNSARVCQQAQAANPDIVDFVTLSRNFGEHNAVMAGLNCAEGDWCIIMDDDFQNPPSEVRRLIAEIRRGHDVVYVRYATKHHSWFRNLGSRLHNWMATRALGKPRDLYLSSFKAMTRFLVREAVHYPGPDPHLDAIILRTTGKIGVIDARHEPRREGKSGYTFVKLVTLWVNLIIPFSLWPLRAVGVIGLVMTLIGAGYGTVNLLAQLTSPDALDELHRASATNWFFRGIQLLALAIVGEYVGRIYRQMNRQPQFIVRSILRRRIGG